MPDRRPARGNLDTSVVIDLEHIESSPEIMSGALCFTGTRVPVQNLFD
jgi:uncharacterized protein (DUF433 family)